MSRPTPTKIAHVGDVEHGELDERELEEVGDRPEDARSIRLPSAPPATSASAMTTGRAVRPLRGTSRRRRPRARRSDDAR